MMLLLPMITLPQMTMLLPRQLQRMMITRLSLLMQIHLQHLPLHLHRLPPKHCLLTQAMALSPYPLLALRLKNVIYR
jgi:hypothetical protein